MSVEASVFSPAQALAEPDVRAALAKHGTEIRLLDFEGHPLPNVPAGSLAGDFIVVGWPAADAATTTAVDGAITTMDKGVIDQLGKAGKLEWCEFRVARFDYEEQWKKYPDEREEYEESVDPEELAAIKRCRTRYALRSGTRPVQCAELVDQISKALKQATNGVIE